MEFYHERQQLQRCLRHTLNNLFQRPLFTTSDLDLLCFQLSSSHPLFNPHRTWFLGNYDVNVLELALGRQDKELSWYDLRDTHFQLLDLGACWAIIVNIQVHRGPLAFLFGGRHWLGLRPLGGRWCNLDSHLDAPVPLDQNGQGDDAAVRRFLMQQVQKHDGKVFIVKERAAAGQGQHAEQPGGGEGGEELGPGREGGRKEGKSKGTRRRQLEERGLQVELEVPITSAATHWDG